MRPLFFIAEEVALYKRGPLCFNFIMFVFQYTNVEVNFDKEMGLAHLDFFFVN